VSKHCCKPQAGSFSVTSAKKFGQFFMTPELGFKYRQNKNNNCLFLVLWIRIRIDLALLDTEYRSILGMRIRIQEHIGQILTNNPDF
jgi:hypothetical protein